MDSTYSERKNNLTPNHVNTINVLSHGLQAGAYLMAFWLAIKAFSFGSLSFISYAGYAILFYSLYKSLTQHYRITSTGKYFQNGIKIGFQVSMIAGVAIFILNVILSLIDSSIAISRFEMEFSSITNIIAANFGILVEVFVIGMISTFVLLQGLKESSSSRPTDN